MRVLDCVSALKVERERSYEANTWSTVFFLPSTRLQKAGTKDASVYNVHYTSVLRLDFLYPCIVIRMDAFCKVYTWQGTV